MIPSQYVDSRDPSHHPVEPEPEVKEYPDFAVDFYDKDEEIETRHVHLKRIGDCDDYRWEATIPALMFIEADDPVTDLIEAAADWGITINERELNILWK